jgi:predicted GNAT family N-acyltransferase
MTAVPVVQIRRVDGEDEMAQLLQIRYEVFCDEQGVPRREERDGRDGQAIHLVAVENGAVLGGCRLLFIGPTVQFSRLAVRQSARRRGLAGRLLALADDESRAAGARRLVLHAQTYTRSLYDAAGYEVRGRVFMEAGIEHVAMEKQL